MQVALEHRTERNAKMNDSKELIKKEEYLLWQWDKKKLHELKKNTRQTHKFNPLKQYKVKAHTMAFLASCLQRFN